MTYRPRKAAVEDRMTRLEKRFEAFYHSTYANTRRKDRLSLDRSWKKATRNLARWEAVFKERGAVLQRIQMIFGRRRKGTKAVYLTASEMTKLKLFLKTDFRKNGLPRR